MVVDEPVRRVRLPDGRPVWLVAGHTQVCTVLADPRFARLPPPQPGSPSTAECPRELNMDGAAHAVVRRLAGRAFTARRIESYRPRVQQLVEGLIDAMAVAGPPADVVSGLVAPLPVLVVCEVLGVPAADRPRFQRWIADLNSITGYGSDGLGRSQADLRAYLADRLAAKRCDPGDDLLSTWAADQA